MDNLVSLLRGSSRLAVVEPDGRSIRYDALQDRVGALAGGLVDLGLRPRDRVVLLVPMGIDLYVSLLALFRVGATAVLVDPAGPMQDNLTRAQPVGLIGSPKAHLLRFTTPALRGLDLLVSTGLTPLPHRRLDGIAGAPIAPDDSDAPALITFTTGTTGRPKMMARSHAFLLAQHRALSGHMVLGDDDVDLPTLPVFLLHSLAGGSTCIIPDADLRRPEAVEPAKIVAQLQRHGVTSASGSPAFFAPLARWLRSQGVTLPEVRQLFLGGARVPARLVHDLSRVFPNAALQVVYGSTEAEPIAVLDARANLDTMMEAEQAGRGALVGTPVPELDLRIIDQEVQVAGDHVNPGYVDDPGADAAFKVREGDRVWHRTGDAGRLDADGALWLIGRTGDQVAGHWPLQIEGAAEGLGFVQRAGLGEVNGAPLVACELRAPPDDWRSQVQAATGVEAVSVGKVPVDPRHNAKIDRPALCALLRQQAAAATPPSDGTAGPPPATVGS
jgi:olefin beta-lactone synthetase